MSGSGARGAAAGSVIGPGAARPRLDHEHRPVTGTVGEARLRPGRRCDACTDSRCESMHPKQPCKDQRPRQPSSPKAAASAGLARRGALRKDVSSDRGGPFGSLRGPGKTDGGTSRRGGRIGGSASQEALPGRPRSITVLRKSSTLAPRGAGRGGSRLPLEDSYLVDPASSHMLVSKIKPCMSKYKHLYCETANGSLNQL